MKRSGDVFNLTEQNPPRKNSTITNMVYEDEGCRIEVMSMGAHTSISPERNNRLSVDLVDSGEMTVMIKDRGNRHEVLVKAGEVYIHPAHQLTGFRTDEQDCVFCEASLERSTVLNDDIHPGEVYRLQDLIPYGAGNPTVRMIASSDFYNMMLLSFTQDTFQAGQENASAAIHVIEGVVDIIDDRKIHTMLSGDSMLVKTGYVFHVRAHANTKVGILYLMGKDTCKR